MSQRLVNQDRLDLILTTLEQRGKSTSAEIAKILGLYSSSVGQYLAYAKKEGRVHCKKNTNTNYNFWYPIKKTIPRMKTDFCGQVITALSEHGPGTIHELAIHAKMNVNTTANTLCTLKKENKVKFGRFNRKYFWALLNQSISPPPPATPRIIRLAKREISAPHVTTQQPLEIGITQEDMDWYESLRGSRERKQQQRARV